MSEESLRELIDELPYDDLLELMTNTVNDIINLPKTELRKEQIKEKNKSLRIVVAKAKQYHQRQNLHPKVLLF